MSSANLTRLTLNGVAMSEGFFNAAIASHFDVPTLTISGTRIQGLSLAFPPGRTRFIVRLLTKLASD